MNIKTAIIIAIIVISLVIIFPGQSYLEAIQLSKTGL